MPTSQTRHTIKIVGKCVPVVLLYGIVVLYLVSQYILAIRIYDSNTKIDLRNE